MEPVCCTHLFLYYMDRYSICETKWVLINMAIESIFVIIMQYTKNKNAIHK